jgi:phage terminase small subunit
MGLRGPAPVIKIRSEPLQDLTPPDWLGNEEAKQFWSKHAHQLQENHLLTAQTVDSFALLADLWERVQSFRGQPTTRAYLDTMKAFTSLAKNFRLLPTEKPEVKEDRFADFGEINI